MKGEYDVVPAWVRPMWAVGVALPLLMLASFFLFERPAPKGHPSRLGSPALWEQAFPPQGGKGGNSSYRSSDFGLRSSP
jgi:hypothetical protein